MNKNTRVFLDIIIGNKAAGRLVIELFEDLTIFTSENFRGLCTGDYGSTPNGYKLSYQDSLIYKVVPNKYLLGGDIILNTGKEGYSIYGKDFIDENFTRRHSTIGLVSMHSKGPNTNSSNFLITLGECPELDDKNVVFGQVIEGIHVLKTIEKASTDPSHKPKVPIRIFNCGQLDDGREHIKFEEFRDQINIYRGYEEKKAQKKEEHLRQYYNLIKNKNNSEHQNDVQIENDIIPDDIEIDDKEDGIEPYNNTRLGQIKARLKKARKLNDLAVAEEIKKNSDPYWEKKLKKKEWEEKEKVFNQDLEKLGLSGDKAYLIDNIAHATNIEKKKQKKEKNSSYGWDIFNSDALLRGYKRRLAKIEIDKEEAKKQNEDKSILVIEPPIHKIERMAQELEQEAERRKKFSRRRPIYEDVDVNFINERNRVYNTKLLRNFQEHAAEIKGNLDRGTAL
jgi:peptidyl-prolyl isomerase G (cyclophilin G)